MNPLNPPPPPRPEKTSVKETLARLWLPTIRENTTPRTSARVHTHAHRCARAFVCVHYISHMRDARRAQTRDRE